MSYSENQVSYHATMNRYRTLCFHGLMNHIYKFDRIQEYEEEL